MPRRMPTTLRPRFRAQARGGSLLHHAPNRRPRFPRSTPPPGPSAHPSGFSVRSQQDSFGFNPTAHQRLPFVPPLPRSSIPGSATMIPQTCPHRLSENQCHNKLGDILCQVYTAQSRHSRFRHTPLPLAFPNQRLRSELRKPATLLARTRDLLVLAGLRIRFPHRLEPPVPREVEMVVGVFKRSGNGSSRMAALTGKPPSCWTP